MKLVKFEGQEGVTYVNPELVTHVIPGDKVTIVYFGTKEVRLSTPIRAVVEQLTNL